MTNEHYTKFAGLFTANKTLKRPISRTMWLLIMGLLETWDLVE